MTDLLASCDLPTAYGRFGMLTFGTPDGLEEVVVIRHGDDHNLDPLIRIHSACFTGDLLGSLRCDCGPQLSAALRLIAEEKHGLVLYLLRHEGRGIGLTNKIKAYKLQEQGYNTVDANERLGLPADARDYRAAIDVLRLLRVERVRLATNNPLKIEALTDAGIAVDRVPHGGFVNLDNRDYLSTKDALMGHLDCSGLLTAEGRSDVDLQ